MLNIPELTGAVSITGEADILSHRDPKINSVGQLHFSLTTEHLLQSSSCFCIGAKDPVKSICSTKASKWTEFPIPDSSLWSLRADPVHGKIEFTPIQNTNAVLV
uniref:Uncharacterized protein n=1 Tax=Rhodosorus marinus TaxID=101924 RepID=A0A7S2ZS39_9RHOD